MLSENQIKRVLEQCNRVEDNYANITPLNTKSINIEGAGQLHRRINYGWVQALRLVLEKNTYPIRNTPLTIDDFLEKGDE